MTSAIHPLNARPRHSGDRLDVHNAAPTGGLAGFMEWVYFRKYIKQNTMRELTGHRVNGCNDKLVITAYEGSGPANATHKYVVTGYDIGTNGATDKAVPGRPEDALEILFQNGPIPEKGTNGVTQEVLLEIVIDRLRSFQSGPFGCRENAIALTKIEEAKMWLQQRTRNRMERGVEGTHQK